MVNVTESLRSNPSEDDRAEVKELFSNLKASLPILETLLAECDHEWGGREAVYRFYHQSYKVYGIQSRTLKIVQALSSLLPDRPLNKWFMEIVSQGTGKKFEMSHNRKWLETTRPMLEAYFHARHFLSVAIEYGKKLEFPPNMLPTGWGTVLYLFDLR